MGPVTTAAIITELPQLIDIEIKEVGTFSVPADVLSGQTVQASALEVVKISVGPGNTFLIEGIGGLVTTEMLTDTVRLSMRPKVNFDSLSVLLEWAEHNPASIPGPPVPKAAVTGGDLYDFLASRLLQTLEHVYQAGWMLRTLPQVRTLDAVQGEIDPVATIEAIYGRQELRFVQRVLVPDHDVPANRVLKSALTVLAGAGARLSPPLLKQARAMVRGLPPITIYPSVGDALEACGEVLGRSRIDPSRAYYFPALRAAEQVLRGARPSDGRAAQIEDAPIRINMPDVFEAAVRNVLSTALGSRFRVWKDTSKTLYRSASNAKFDKGLEPDMVVQKHMGAKTAAAILDAKYKDSPSADDHYQLAAYAEAYKVPLAGFISITEELAAEGVKNSARSHQNVEIFEYALYSGDLVGSLERFTQWVRGKIRV